MLLRKAVNKQTETTIETTMELDGHLEQPDGKNKREEWRLHFTNPIEATLIIQETKTKKDVLVVPIEIWNISPNGVGFRANEKLDLSYVYKSQGTPDATYRISFWHDRRKIEFAGHILWLKNLEIRKFAFVYGMKLYFSTQKEASAHNWMVNRIAKQVKERQRIFDEAFKEVNSKLNGRMSYGNGN